MTKINDIQILDDIELENIVGGAQEPKKKAVKKKVVKKAAVKKTAASSLAMNGGSNAVTVPDSAV